MTYYEYRDAIFASNFTATEKLTALAIGSFFNYSKDEMCWPSNKTLSKITGLSISALVRAKKALVSEGYLEVWRRIDNSNMYRPLIPKNAPMLTQNDEYTQVERRVYAEVETNNEYNNEVNNEKNNEMNNNESSNEDSYSFSNINKAREDINISLETTEYPLAEIKETPAAENYWSKKAEEIWG